MTTTGAAVSPPPTNGDHYDLVVFDADDTLWRSEDAFRAAEAMFIETVSPYAPEGIDVAAVLRAVELDNLPTSGYGVKAFALSMVQAAVTATQGAVPSLVIGALVDRAHDMLTDPVELLPGVPESLAAVAKTHRIALITKGDLVHQVRKIRTSGLEHLFERVEVVLEKDCDTYRRIFGEWGVDPGRVVMVGNSVPSDIEPIVELGGAGLHIPYHVTWSHEVVAHTTASYTELTTITEVRPWLDTPANTTADNRRFNSTR